MTENEDLRTRLDFALQQCEADASLIAALMRERDGLVATVAEARAKIARLEAHRDELLDALAKCRAQRLVAIAALESIAPHVEKSLEIVRQSRNPTR